MRVAVNASVVSNPTPGGFNDSADTLTQYKLTGQLPNGGAAGLAGLTSPKKRGKKPRLNKDGSEKQPRKPTAYNAWMQTKLRELKEAVGHDPDQKHVDTFKQAAHIWAELPKEEKDRINAQFREKQKDEVPAAGGNAAEADAVLDAAGEEDDDDDEDVDMDEDEGAAVPAMAAAPESSAEETSDEEEAPAPAPKPKPAPLPAPITPISEAKKKKKRKQAADPVPLKLEATAAAAGADKQKKKKKKKDAA